MIKNDRQLTPCNHVECANRACHMTRVNHTMLVRNSHTHVHVCTHSFVLIETLISIPLLALHISTLCHLLVWLVHWQDVARKKTFDTFH